MKPWWIEACRITDTHATARAQRTPGPKLLLAVCNLCNIGTIRATYHKAETGCDARVMADFRWVRITEDDLIELKAALIAGRGPHMPRWPEFHQSHQSAVIRALIAG